MHTNTLLDYICPRYIAKILLSLREQRNLVNGPVGGLDEGARNALYKHIVDGARAEVLFRAIFTTAVQGLVEQTKFQIAGNRMPVLCAVHCATYAVRRGASPNSGSDDLQVTSYCCRAPSYLVVASEFPVISEWCLPRGLDVSSSGGTLTDQTSPKVSTLNQSCRPTRKICCISMVSDVSYLMLGDN